MHGLVQDVRYAWRQLRRSPGFALTAALSLALGIGATTAVFSVIYAALISPFPYRGADRLVRLAVQNKTGRGVIGLNGPQIRELRKLSCVESLLAADYHPMTMTGHDVPTNVGAIGLISSGFADLGLPPLLGRGIEATDSIYGQEPEAVVLLSYKFWRRQFLSDPGVVGKTLELDRKKYTVIGVASPRFNWYDGDVYLPLKLNGDPAVGDAVVLRLKRGVSFAAADAELQPVIEQFAKVFPKRFPEQFRVHVDGLNEWVVRGVGGTLYLLFGAVGLLLAIGCGNVSILLLARGAARQHELAVRAAVGAGRGRMVRQLLTESLLLSAIGVALGVWVSYATLALIRTLLPKDAFSAEVVIRINLPVLLFSAGVAIATGILFGLWPALRLSRPEVSSMVQAGSTRVAGTVHAERSHGALVAAQIALTLVLVAGAGAAMEGFLRLLQTPLGYDPHNVLSLVIPLHDNAYTTWAARGAYYEQLRAKLDETPGVLMASISLNSTPPQSRSVYRLEILGKPEAQEQRALFNTVDAGYFAALRIPLLQGRLWTASENATAAHVAVINRAMARRYFPAGDAIGHSVKMPGIGNGTEGWISAPGASGAWLQIIGVVADARNDGLDKPVQPAVFVPYTLSMYRVTEVLVRTVVPPPTLLRTLRAQIAAVNPDQQIYDYAEGLVARIAEEPEMQQAHLTSWVFGLFAGLALALAAVGLFSVVSYTVAQRANEFGIRVALGARPGDVLRLVFGSTAVSVGSGIAAGLLLTVAMNRILAQWIKSGSRDPLALLAGVGLLGFVSAIACALPAWRAARADPMEALRCP